MNDFLKEKQARQNLKQGKNVKHSQKGTGKNMHSKKGHIKKG